MAGWLRGEVDAAERLGAFAPRLAAGGGESNCPMDGAAQARAPAPEIAEGDSESPWEGERMDA